MLVGASGLFVSHSFPRLAVDPPAVDSELRNETSILPYKWFPPLFGGHKTPALAEADTNLTALEDEMNTVTSIHQSTFKATTLEDHTLALLDPNAPEPILIIPKESNGVTKRAPAFLNVSRKEVCQSSLWQSIFLDYESLASVLTSAVLQTRDSATYHSCYSVFRTQQLANYPSITDQASFLSAHANFHNSSRKPC